ncbi:hypothetical protein B0A48_17835 [Cryoendolithus antarcticus]|uniref:Uncharacterized protein n=1 Tax=Cryoendolithus antarcticus TaxID=1507870 RepID=A0A1V8SB17_9PEZI|nr:hypothetical protein B0A48_17835 [Cryoendolithus antarcticus]
MGDFESLNTFVKNSHRLNEPQPGPISITPAFIDLLSMPRRPPPGTRRPERDSSVTPDSFVGQSDDLLRQKFRVYKADREVAIEAGRFLVLDDRGAEDQTVLLHCWHEPGPHSTVDEDGCNELDGNHESRWLVWRIPWRTASSVTANMSTGVWMLYDLFFRRVEDFTSPEGMFDADRALRQY